MEVEHAEAALIVLESHGRRIHVLFTDIQMPGAMDGLGLAHQLKALAIVRVARYLGPPPPGSTRIS